MCQAPRNEESPCNAMRKNATGRPRTPPHPFFSPFAPCSRAAPTETCLDGGLVGDGDNRLGLVVGHGDLAGVTGEARCSLDRDDGAVGLGLLLGSGVVLDTLDEVLARPREVDVLDPDVDALLDVPVLDLLVDDDADGRLGDVVDNTGLAVVDLVGHTLLDGTVGLDVNDVTDPAQDVVLALLLRSAPITIITRFQSPPAPFASMWWWSIFVPVLSEVGGQVDHTLLPEVPGEGIL